MTTPFQPHENPDLSGAEMLLEAFDLITGPRQDAYSHPEPWEGGDAE